jgi:outer membrane protein OmpA-like peptidoglycan-associated protein
MSYYYGNEDVEFQEQLTVEAYIIDKGIDPTQLSSASNGARQPINTNANTANRRVEIIK